MNSVSFVPLNFSSDSGRLVKFLTSEDWPFHVNSKLTDEKVQSFVRDGFFSGADVECFWITGKNHTDVGFIRLFDLDDVDDGYPLFDLRVKKDSRGQGIGFQAVRWLCKYLFEKHSNLDRVVGTARVDNVAMIKTFRKGGFVKEGHYRNDWVGSDGKSYDTVRYCILRNDWLSGEMTPVHWMDEA